MMMWKGFDGMLNCYQEFGILWSYLVSLILKGGFLQKTGYLTNTTTYSAVSGADGGFCDRRGLEI